MLFSARRNTESSSTNKSNKIVVLPGRDRKEPRFSVAANGGMEEHVHLLIQLPPVLTLAKAVSLLKANSSKWMTERGIKFGWQMGYGAFSVSASNLSMVERYIANQARDHGKMAFEDEFVALLRKHGIQFDPKYVFG